MPATIKAARSRFIGNALLLCTLFQHRSKCDASIASTDPARINSVHEAARRSGVAGI